MAPDGRRRAIGLLIAAGHGRRFDPSGQQSKLEQPLAGKAIAVHAALALLAGCDHVIAAVRPGSSALVDALASLGCQLAPVCGEEGMGNSIACAAQAALARGVVDPVLILPADMPWVKPTTIRALIEIVAPDDAVVLPTYGGADGHPVRFPARLLPPLARLAGERGARALLQAAPTLRIPTDDGGVVRDVDVPADLAPTDVEPTDPDTTS